MCVGPVALQVIPGGNYPRIILLDFRRDIGHRNWYYSVIVFFSPSRQISASSLKLSFDCSLPVRTVSLFDHTNTGHYSITYWQCRYINHKYNMKIWSFAMHCWLHEGKCSWYICSYCLYIHFTRLHKAEKSQDISSDVFTEWTNINFCGFLGYIVRSISFRTDFFLNNRTRAIYRPTN